MLPYGSLGHTELSTVANFACMKFISFSKCVRVIYIDREFYRYTLYIYIYIYHPNTFTKVLPVWRQLLCHVCEYEVFENNIQDSKVHGANMGPT